MMMNTAGLLDQKSQSVPRSPNVLQKAFAERHFRKTLAQSPERHFRKALAESAERHFRKALAESPERHFRKGFAMTNDWHEPRS